jgi:DNA-binding NtrC family response regulator
MTVLLAADLHEAWMHLNSQRVHVLIADQRMPGLKGSELLTLAKERFPEVCRMLITAYSDLEAVIDAVNNGGVTKYFAKPWVHDQLVKAVQDAFTAIREEEAREAYLKRLEEANRQLEFALRQRLLS